MPDFPDEKDVMEDGRVPLEHFGKYMFKGFASVAQEINIPVPLSAEVSSTSSGTSTPLSANFPHNDESHESLILEGGGEGSKGEPLIPKPRGKLRRKRNK